MTINIDLPPSAPARLPTAHSNAPSAPATVIATAKHASAPIRDSKPLPSSPAPLPASTGYKCSKACDGSSAMRLFALIFLLFCFSLTIIGFIPFIGIFFTLISLFFIPIAFIACLAARWTGGIIISFALPLTMLFSTQFQMNQVSNILKDIGKNTQQVESRCILHSIFKISDEQHNCIKKTASTIHAFQSKMLRIIQDEESYDESKTNNRKVDKLLPVAPATPVTPVTPVAPVV